LPLLKSTLSDLRSRLGMVELRDGMLGDNRGSRASGVFVRGVEEREKKCGSVCRADGKWLNFIFIQLSKVRRQQWASRRPGLRLRRT
jgi:hypothetical protein